MEQENFFPEITLQQLSSEDVFNTSLSQLLKTCQFHKALPLLETELDSKRASLGEFNIGLVSVLNQMTDIQIALSQYSKASDMCQKSEQILQNHQEDLNYSSLIAHTYQNMALISRENQYYKEALDLINKSLALSSPDSLQNIEIHRIKALILSDLRYYKEALSEVQRCLDNVKKLDTMDHILEARVYNTLGDIHLALHDWEKANIAFNTASEICEKYDLSHIEMVKASDGEIYSYFEGGGAVSGVFGRVSTRRAQEILDNCFGKEAHHPARILHFLTSARCMSWKKDDSGVVSFIRNAIREGEEFYGTDSEKMREVCLSAAKAAGEFSDIIEDLVESILDTSIEGPEGRELVNLYIQQCHAKILSGYSYELIFPEVVSAIKGLCGAASMEMLNPLYVLNPSMG